MKWIKTTYKWCHRTFWYSLVGLIITLAIAVSLFRLYLPDVKGYREEIEAFASEVLDHDVRINSMDAKLSGFTPLIIFDDVYLLDTKSGKEIIHFEEARLTIDLLRSLFKMELVPESFTVIGVDLGVKRKHDGSFAIQGLDIDKIGKQMTLDPDEKGSDELANWFFKRGKLAIKNSRVVWQDAQKHRKHKSTQFENVNFYLRNDGDRHQLTGTVTLPVELGRELEVAFDFTGNILKPAEWYGKVFYKADGLNLVNWGVKPNFMHASLEQGTLDVALWGDWNAGIITSFTADVKAKDFIFNFGEQETPFSMQQLGGLVDWQRNDLGWKLNVKDFQFKGKNETWPVSSLSINYAKEEELITAYSSFLRLDDIKQLLIDSKVLDKALHSNLVKIDPGGDLKDIYLEYSFDETQGQFSLASKFSGLSLQPWEHFPGIENVTGTVWLDESKGRFEIESTQAKVLVPEMFRVPLELSSLQGKIDWYKKNKAWHVNSDEVVATSPDIKADLGFYALLSEDGTSPYIDLQVSYKNGDASKTHKYLPVSIMDDNLISWLDNAFKSGTVSSGGAILNGRMKDFPFKDRSGTLLADFKTKDVELHYRSGWPNLMVNDADLEVTGLGLSVKSGKSTLYNSQLHDIDVSIKSFEAPIIYGHSRLHGPTRDLTKFLVESPISPEAKTVLDQTRILGKASGSGMLQLPLSELVSARAPLHYEVKIQLHDNEFNAWQGKLVAKKVNGDIKVSPKGVFSDNINFDFLSGHSSAKVYTTTINKQQNIRLSMHGKIDTSQISEHVDLSVLDRISGKTDWQGILALGNKESPGYFQFVSRLKGVELKLPAPLAKISNTEKPFNVLIQFPDKDKLPINIKYGGELSAAFVLNLDTLKEKPIDKGDILFPFTKDGDKSTTEEPRLPERSELVIRGRLLEFKVDDWLALINKDVDKKDIGFTSLNIPIRLDMDYLKIVTNEVETDEEQEKDPRKIALFDGDIQTLFFNNTDLGHVRFKMARHEDGLSFKELFIDSAYMHLEGDGSWLLRNGKQLTNLVVVVTTDNLGLMMRKLGFAAIVKNGTAKAVIQANWSDAPDKFSVEKLNGNLGIVVDDGLLSDVKPGAGRLLGLFSLAELPRRLLLDFSELKKGFSFKQIVGQFEIEDGDMYADSLKIVSPIALITIQGRTGLAARDFDQMVSVVPNVSNAIPVVSWLAWGGQIGALAFLLDQMFGDIVNTSVTTEYRITGSWDDPQIKKIEKEIPDDFLDDEEEYK